MRRFSVFIAVDTGPIHVAHALGIPLIDILGPVNDIELTPKGKNIKYSSLILTSRRRFSHSRNPAIKN